MIYPIIVGKIEILRDLKTVHKTSFWKMKYVYVYVYDYTKKCWSVFSVYYNIWRKKPVIKLRKEENRELLQDIFNRILFIKATVSLVCNSQCWKPVKLNMQDCGRNATRTVGYWYLILSFLNSIKDTMVMLVVNMTQSNLPLIDCDWIAYWWTAFLDLEIPAIYIPSFG